MNDEELENWIMGLPLQTLTEDLKREIWEKVNETIKLYADGKY